MGQYEFTSKQNEHIDRLRSILLDISVLLFALGFLLMLRAHLLANTFAQWLVTLVASFYFVLAFVYFRPVDNFERITTTEGDDMKLLMIAMEDLRKAFSAAYVILGILSVLVFVGILRLLQ